MSFNGGRMGLVVSALLLLASTKEGEVTTIATRLRSLRVATVLPEAGSIFSLSSTLASQAWFSQSAMSLLKLPGPFPMKLANPASESAGAS